MTAAEAAPAKPRLPIMAAMLKAITFFFISRTPVKKFVSATTTIDYA
jgi:hypothetical protein